MNTDRYGDFVTDVGNTAATDLHYTELHLHVFNNNLRAVANLIRTKSPAWLSQPDVHGNTALHLACMLGHIESATMLLEAGASVKFRNRQMWTPLNEAISYGDRDLSRSK
jgi:ankyrin repeat protein